MIGRDDAVPALTLAVSPEPSPAELAAIVAVLGGRQVTETDAPTVRMPWRDAARHAVVHRAWPRPAPGGWAAAARREMQHAGQG